MRLGKARAFRKAQFTRSKCAFEKGENAASAEKINFEMVLNKTFRLRPRALQDIEEIDAYTFREFGTAQADKYIRSLFEAFQSLFYNPNLGRGCEYIRLELKAYAVNSHVVFFKVTASGLTIIRVLHKAMDHQRHV